MNNNGDIPAYRRYEPPGKKKMVFYAYLFMVGILVGVVLTNTFGPAQTNDSGEEVLTASAGNEEIAPYAISHPEDEDVHSDYESMVIAATNNTMPAVVSIYTSGTQYYRFRNPIWDSFYGIQSQPVNAMGSGIIIDPIGIIVTNEHVIADVKDLSDANIKVELPDGRSFDATIRNDFPNQDIAVLSIEGSELPYIEFGSSSNLSTGQTVLAIGNPFGRSIGGMPTVTRGIVSATKRSLISKNDNRRVYMKNMIQTDASINYGNSGGPLVDLYGKLVGINTAIFQQQGGGSIGLGFAIPVDRVKLLLDSIDNPNYRDDITSGIKIQTLTSNIAAALNYNGRHGVIISEVTEGSPGDRGNFMKGDIIAQIDGFDVYSVEQVLNIFRGAIPGEIYEINVFRGGETHKLQLKLTENN